MKLMKYAEYRNMLGAVGPKQMASFISGLAAIITSHVLKAAHIYSYLLFSEAKQHICFINFILENVYMCCACAAE